MPGIVQPASTTILQPSLPPHQLLHQPPGQPSLPAQSGENSLVREESLIPAVGQQKGKLSSGNLGSKVSAVRTVAPLAVETVGNSVNVDVEPSPGPGPNPYTGILFPLVAEKQLPESSSEPQTSETTTVPDSQEDTLDNTLDSTELELTELENNNIGDYETEIVSEDVV